VENTPSQLNLCTHIAQLVLTYVLRHDCIYHLLYVQPRHASREHLEDSIVSTSRNLGRFEAPGSSRRPAGLRDPAILHAMCVAGRRGPLLARNNHERLHSIRPLTRDRRQTKPAAASIGVRRDSTQGRRTRRAPSSATATACRHARAALSPPAPATSCRSTKTTWPR
jgi:hypothetical protein